MSATKREESTNVFQPKNRPQMSQLLTLQPSGRLQKLWLCRGWTESLRLSWPLFFLLFCCFCLSSGNQFITSVVEPKTVKPFTSVWLGDTIRFVITPFSWKPVSMLVASLQGLNVKIDSNISDKLIPASALQTTLARSGVLIFSVN